MNNAPQPIQRFTPRELRADEVQIRKGSFVGADKSKMELLCFLDARAGMSILDETVGEFGWACQYATVNGVTYCGIGIKDPVTLQYVWKYDAGGDGNIEPEKSVASSAFKRACSRWGIGRSLYTTPRIVVPNEPTGYKCTEYEVEEGKCVRLTVVDSDGEVVFHMEPGYTTVKTGKTELPEEDKSLPWEERLKEWCAQMKNATEDPDTHTLLLAFYYANRGMTRRGEQYGCAQLWKWLKKDLKDGRTILDDSNPRHPQLIKK